MRPHTLCLERLHRILRVFQREGDEVSIRRFRRNYEVYPWEIEQAAELGWLVIKTRKPRIGRPSTYARKLSDSASAKLPPYRSAIPREISFRHQNFVHAYLCNGGPLTSMNARRAYLATFPNAKSTAGADASAHRLLRHPDVRAYLTWIRVCSGKEIPPEAQKLTSWTRQEIREILIHHLRQDCRWRLLQL